MADSIDEMTGVSDNLDYNKTFDNGFLGQQQVNDEEFQKTLKDVKEKQAKHAKGKNKKKEFKGKDINQENNSNFLGETAEKNLLISIPLTLINNDENEIPIGHYKIVGEKVNDKVYLDFYQSATLVAKVPATETTNDFSESGINFVKLFPYNEKRVKIIYGSMDFNAYTFIEIKNEITDQN